MSDFLKRAASTSTTSSTLVGGECKASTEPPCSSKFKEVDLDDAGDVHLVVEKTHKLVVTPEQMDKFDAQPGRDGLNRKDGAIYLDWEDDDESRPQKWSQAKKWSMALSIMWTTFSVAAMSGGYEAW